MLCVDTLSKQTAVALKEQRNDIMDPLMMCNVKDPAPY